MLSRTDNDLLTQTSANTSMGRMMRSMWQPIALTEELDAGAPVPIRILGEDLVLFRNEDGSLGLVGRRCPHRLSDLSYGRVEDGGLRCVYHGWLFDKTGKCLEQPAERGTAFRDKIKHPAYPCQELGGLVFAYLGPAESMPVLPHYEALVARPEHRVVTKFFTACNYLQAMENHIDPAHVAFLHRKLGQEKTDISNISSTAGRDGLNNPSAILSAVRHAPHNFDIENTDFGMRVITTHDLGEKTYFRCNTCIAPNVAAVTGVTAGDGYSLFWNVPIDDRSHWKYEITYRRSRPFDSAGHMRQFNEEVGPDFRPKRNIGNHHLQDRSEMKTTTFAGFGQVILMQDIANIEGQGEIVDRTGENLGSTDKPVIALRQSLLAGLRRFEARATNQSGETPIPQPVVLAEFVSSSDADITGHIRRRIAEEDRLMASRMVAAE